MDYDCQSLHSGLNHLEKRCPVLPKGRVWHSKRNLSSDLSICPRCQIFGGKIGHHLMFGICPTPPLDSLSTNRFFHLATTSWYWTTLLAKISHFSLYHSRYLQMCLHQWKLPRKTRSEGQALLSAQICTFAPLTVSTGHVNWIFCQFFCEQDSKITQSPPRRFSHFSQNTRKESLASVSPLEMQKTWTGYWNIDTLPSPNRTPLAHLRNQQKQPTNSNHSREILGVCWRKQRLWFS